ncbi:MAG: TRAP transporter small permease [Spirochaetota bacterium]
MKRVLKWLDLNSEVCVIVFFSIAMTIIVFAQVIMRYVFNSAFSWAEEVSRYLFIWVIYLGISYSCRTRRHVRITFLLDRFPDALYRVVIVLGDVLFLFYCVIVIVYGIRLNMNTYQLGQFTSAIRISYVFVYLSIVFSAALSSVRIIRNILHKIKYWHADIKQFEYIETGSHLFSSDSAEKQ